MTDETKTIIIAHETIAKSIAVDLVTLGIFLVMIGLGWVAGSGVLSFVGAIGAMLIVGVRASGRFKPMTIAEARAELDRIEDSRSPAARALAGAAIGQAFRR